MKISSVCPNLGENGPWPVFYAEDDDFLVLKIKTIDFFSKLEFFCKAQRMGVPKKDEGGHSGQALAIVCTVTGGTTVVVGIMDSQL